MMVSDDQLFQIQGYLMSEGVTDVGLQEDLVDHFCCLIEGSTEEGESFSQAFEKAKQAIAPVGAGEIQQDLNYLLTIKKKVMLRKVVFVFGFFGVLEIMMAMAFFMSGILEAEVSGLLAMAGILTLSVSVLPYWFYQLYKRSVQNLQQA